MIKRKKLLLLISFTVSVNAFLLAGCGAKTDETTETAVEIGRASCRERV